MRILSPTPLRWTAALTAFAGVVFAIVALINFPGWDSLFGAFMVGACFVATLHTIILARAHHALHQMMTALEILKKMNADLISQLADRDGSPPISPDAK